MMCDSHSEIINHLLDIKEQQATFKTTQDSMADEIKDMKAHVKTQNGRVDKLESWNDRAKGALKMLSIIGGIIVALVTIYSTVSGETPKAVITHEVDASLDSLIKRQFEILDSLGFDSLVDSSILGYIPRHQGGMVGYSTEYMYNATGDTLGTMVLIIENERYKYNSRRDTTLDIGDLVESVRYMFNL